VILDDLRSEPLEGDVVRSARVRWEGGDLRLRVRVPEAAAGPAGDATPFLAAALLPAMRRGEDLEVEGAVSPLLLERCEELQSIYASWDLSLRACDVRAEEAVPDEAPGGRAVGAFFSGGVDSMYTAIAARESPLGGLVLYSDLAPIDGPPAHAREQQPAARAAALLGLPLTSVSSNVRELAEPILDSADAKGAGLACLALSLGGGFRRLTVPSWADYESLAPCGSHPLLDRLFSTELVELEHDALVHGRLGKVGALAREHPYLLPLLKVCPRIDEPANCGLCHSCLWTMICLSICGVLERATMFPPEVDLAAVAKLRLSTRTQRIVWGQVCRALSPGDATHKAVTKALRRSAGASLGQRWRGRFRPRGRLDLLPPPWYEGASAFSRQDTNGAVSVLRGRPYP